MAYIIAVVNQKGGVGKTTTTVNVATYLANQGRFVLLVDLDPQANATAGLGLDYRNIEKGVYETLIGTCGVREAIQPTSIEGLKILPSTTALAGATIELVNAERREFRLADSLLSIRNDFDYIFIDCPPSLGLLTLNGLTSAERVLIPVQAEYFALEGLGQLLKTLDLVQKHLKPDLEVLGAVLTMFDGRNRLSSDVMNELYKFFPNKIFRSVIPRNVRLAEAPSFGQPISQYDPWSKGARAYARLVREIMDLEHAL